MYIPQTSNGATKQHCVSNQSNYASEISKMWDPTLELFKRFQQSIGLMFARIMVSLKPIFACAGRDYFWFSCLWQFYLRKEVEPFSKPSKNTIHVMHWKRSLQFKKIKEQIWDIYIIKWEKSLNIHINYIL